MERLVSLLKQIENDVEPELYRTLQSSSIREAAMMAQDLLGEERNIQTLREAGFSVVEIKHQWSNNISLAIETRKGLIEYWRPEIKYFANIK
jgi:hypothetical protein